MNGSQQAGTPSASDFTIRDGAVVAYAGASTDVTVPEGTTAIAEGAFAYSRVRTVRMRRSFV